MAFIQARTSRGKKYWSIVECRRVNGKPRTFILEYLGTADSLLKQRQQGLLLKSYSHGDISALLNAAIELDVINIINKYIPCNTKGTKPKRDGLTVGASFLLAAIGRVCHPTSKLGWYNWCKGTSLEYSLKSQLKALDSQHFWDQMNTLPVEAIPKIEEEIITKLIDLQDLKLDCLFFDTTNFFTFINTTNNHCDLPRRGRNKQKRFDLRQIGLALLVSREDQFPLFHQTYHGNKNDITVFKENCGRLLERLQRITKELTDVTLVFDKGNNSKENFATLAAQTQDCYYVVGLVSSYFKELIKEANKNFVEIELEGETIPAYRTKSMIWGQELTCVITISSQLKEGQIQGIMQNLAKKQRTLNNFKQQLENPKGRKKFTRSEIKNRIQSIIKGQFIEDILKYEIIKHKNGKLSFTHFIDNSSFDELKKEILGRKIVATNRHKWNNVEILLAYRGQSKVEYAFRNLKNPYHMAIRPQYHWTDQKIEAHFLICIIGYLLTVYIYRKTKHCYFRNISHFMDDLRDIRLVCITERKNKISYQLEEISPSMREVTKKLNISNETIRPKINFSDYI